MHGRSNQSLLFVVVCLFLGVMSSSAMAQEQADPELENARAKANTELETFAAALARELAHPGFRGQLRAELARSRHHEGSIPVGQLINAAKKGSNQPPGLQKLASLANQARSNFHGRSSSLLSDLDIYFPVDEHREKWKGQPDLLVSFTPLVGNSGVESLQAYSVKTGKPVSLRPDQPPPVPVLVVSKEDHSQVEYPQKPADIEKLPDVKPDFVGSEVEYRPVPQEPGNSYVGVKYFKMRGIREFWWEGDPEIYLLFGQQRGSGCIAAKMYLHEVNRPHEWYNLWSRSSPARWYFDSSFSGKMTLEVWEYDGGYRKLHLSGTSNDANYTCQWWRYSGDDYFNRVSLSRNNFNYDRNYWVKLPGGIEPSIILGAYIPPLNIEVDIAWRKQH